MNIFLFFNLYLLFIVKFFSLHNLSSIFSFYFMFFFFRFLCPLLITFVTSTYASFSLFEIILLHNSGEIITDFSFTHLSGKLKMKNSKRKLSCFENEECGVVEITNCGLFWCASFFSSFFLLFVMIIVLQITIGTYVPRYYFAILVLLRNLRFFFHVPSM